MNNKSKTINGNEVPDWIYNNIAEASRNARKIYFLYLGFLSYSFLTVVSTTDKDILLNETVRLPIVNVDVPINGFFVMAPIIGIFVFTYLQFYLDKLKSLKKLLEEYPSSNTDRLYPWIFNFVENSRKGLVHRLEMMVLKISLWGFLPMVLGLFSLWYVKKHEPTFSYVVGVMPLLAAFVILLFWWRYEDVKFSFRHPIKFIKSNYGKAFLILLMFLYEATLLSTVIPDANQGKWERSSSFNLRLGYENLVNEPTETDYEGLYWQDLYGAHLEKAILVSCILKRADLRKSHLKGAHLLASDLRRADLEMANLESASLESANLESANLEGASLVGANLSFAKLKGAFLSYANLTDAYISKAILVNAILFNTNFTGALLKEANLQEANLSLANLQGTNLSLANLQGANLSLANLQGANLKGAKNLSIAQLFKVLTLYETELDPELMEQIKKDYPHLLDKPKNEKMRK